jgi:hypothetical protein
VSRRPLLAIPLAVLMATSLAGCFTGQRPTFDSTDAFQPGTATGDTNVDPILDQLDHVTKGPATAHYDVLTKYGNLRSSASVALAPGTRNVIVENTRYIQNDTGTATCTVDKTIACSSGFDPTRISDVGITVDFYASDAAKRLRRDTQAKIGPTVPHADTIAGQKVACVDIPLNGGTASYCVLPDGLLAKRDDGDIRIVLKSFVATADPAQFTIPK